MSFRGTPALENLPVLEQYRHGLVHRWNEMMSVIDDVRDFSTRMRMMIAELKDLATNEDRKFLDASIDELRKSEKYKLSDDFERVILADKLNVLTEIFRSRVVSSRWILPFDAESRGGFGQVASSVQQNLQTNFFRLDHRSLFEVYFFVQQIEILLHNLENTDAVHESITSEIYAWIIKWGFKPYGVTKKTKRIEKTIHRGRPTSLMLYLKQLHALDDAEQAELLTTSSDIDEGDEDIDNEEFDNDDIDEYDDEEIDGLDDFEEDIADESDLDEDQSMEIIFDPKIDKDVDAFITNHNLDPTIPNYVHLINHDHIKLLKYRDRKDYTNALIGLLNILKFEMKILRKANVNLLTAYVNYNQPTTVNM